MLGLPDAQHAEYGASSEDALITRAACDLPDPAGGPHLRGPMKVRLDPGSRIAGICGATEIEEQFGCSYALNPRYRLLFERSELHITGRDGAGDPRVVELTGAAFFIGTLFLPQLRPASAGPHPLVRAFVDRAVNR